MPTYLIYQRVSTYETGYYVTADSESEARAFCARVVPGAGNATDAIDYDCVLDSEYSPPPGVVLSTGGITFSEGTKTDRS